MNNNSERPLGWTSLEESKQLIKAGISIESADMYWAPDTGTVVPTPYMTDNVAIRPIPCWSLGTLVQLLPLSIQTDNPYKYNLEFKLYPGPEYMVAYCIDQSHHPMVYTEKHGSLIEACIEMIIWLLNNKLYEQEKC